jgi:hypothetical protein
LRFEATANNGLPYTGIDQRLREVLVALPNLIHAAWMLQVAKKH